MLDEKPCRPSALRAEIYIPPQAPARHVRMLVDGELVGEETFARPGAYVIAVPTNGGAPSLTVTLTVDKTFSTPADQRKLGIIVISIGFR